MSALLLCAAAWAGCGGFAAVEKVAYAQRVGLSAAGVSVVMTLLAAAFVRHRGISWRILAPMVVICAAHPGLWMEPDSVDCGQQMIAASVVFSLQSAALLGWVLARPRIIDRMAAEGSVVVVEEE